MSVLVRSRLRRKLIFLRKIQVLAQKILAASGVPAAELSLDLVGDRRIRRLNRQYRGRDDPTDVLAFPMQEVVGPTSSLLGDVVISLHTAARQAEARGHSLEHEVVMLLIHGTLHLCGYDHERGAREARRMRRKELAILESLKPLPRMFEHKPSSVNGH